MLKIWPGNKSRSVNSKITNFRTNIGSFFLFTIGQHNAYECIIIMCCIYNMYIHANVTNIYILSFRRRKTQNLHYGKLEIFVIKVVKYKENKKMCGTIDHYLNM